MKDMTAHGGSLPVSVHRLRGDANDVISFTMSTGPGKEGSITFILIGD
jgi:hypothetical protein